MHHAFFTRARGPLGIVALVAFSASLSFTNPAFAQGSTTPQAAVKAAPRGVAVVALDGATEDAWPLAQAVYGDSGLRPAAIDDTKARLLAGEAPHEGATTKERELSELRAAVHGDDAPSRKILSSIADETSASALLVVAKSGVGVTARLFSATRGAFDDAPLPFPSRDDKNHLDWSSVENATRERTGVAPASSSSIAAPASNAPAQPSEKPKSTSFFSSPWFWGALGVAAVTGVTAYLLTRQSSGDASSYPLSGKVER